MDAAKKKTKFAKVVGATPNEAAKIREMLAAGNLLWPTKKARTQGGLLEHRSATSRASQGR